MKLPSRFLRFVACALTLAAANASAAVQLFPLSDVRLTSGPFLEAQQTDLHYLLELDPDRLLAPILREAGLPPKKDRNGSWKWPGLDGPMGGHCLSARALVSAATGNSGCLGRL